MVDPQVSVQLFMKFILAQLQRELDFEGRSDGKGRETKQSSETPINPIDELLGYTVTSKTFFFQSNIEETV